jgi:non-lysosomal glucosylceramidase
MTKEEMTIVSMTAETSRLFPDGLPDRNWVSFNSKGYSTPVTGVIYRDGDPLPGMPLGGLGTGYMRLGTDGTLDYVSSIFNCFVDNRTISEWTAFARDVQPGQQMRQDMPTFRLPFLGLSVDGQTTLLSLHDIKTKEIQRAEGIDYWGHYPMADLHFKTRTPISVMMRTWVPFIPGHENDSNTPGAVFSVYLTNVSDQIKKGTLAFSFHVPRRLDLGSPREVVLGGFSRKNVQGAFTGQVVSTEVKGKIYAYALGIAGQDQLRIGGRLDTFDGRGNPEPMPFAAWNRIAASLPEPVSHESGTSVALDFILQPGESKTVHFVLAWFAPTWDSVVGKTYQNKYVSRYQSAGEVAEYLACEHESLFRRILAWQDVIYSEKKLPGWLQDSLINVLAILTQNSFWMTSTDPGHWWGEQGLFCVNESLLSCPQQSCIANDQFGEWPINLLFPKLGLRKLEAFRHYTNPNTGQTPSALGPINEPDQPWSNQLIAVDGQIYVHMVDRYRLSTGDDKMLDEWYPSVKAGMKFMFTVDKDGDGLPDINGCNHYFDMWPMYGIATYVSTYWLATLHIAGRMAELQHDDSFAEECRQWIVRGSQSLEPLWNDPVGSYLLYLDQKTGAKSDTVLTDQLIGDMFAQIHGIPGILPKERLPRIMATLEHLNVAATQHGIRLAARPDGSEDRSCIYYSPNMVPSYSTHAAAMTMIHWGDTHFAELGLEIVRRAWENLVCLQDMAWEMPAYVGLDGTRAIGLEYYHNTMLWILPMALLNQGMKDICSDGGFVSRVRNMGDTVTEGVT